MAGLDVRVEGDLPRDVMERIGASVRMAVLESIADLDIAPPLYEWPLPVAVDGDFGDPDGGGPFGIVLKDEEPMLGSSE
jgi:hypothetical protein